MQSSNDIRIREVLGTTQDNLESAVGAAYSRWTLARREYIDPFCISLSSCWTGPYALCFGKQKQAINNRRESFDFFFDRYDEDDLYDPGEMEHLMSSDDFDVGGTGYSDEEFGPFAGEDRGGPSLEQRQPGEHQEMELHSGDNPLPAKPPLSRQVLQYYSGTSARSSLESFFYSIFPFWKKKRLNYRPSAAGLRGFKYHDNTKNRTRSSTKSSVESSETYRSRGDLFSEGDIDEDMMADAQIVSDNFANMLPYGDSKSKTLRPQSQRSQSSINEELSSIESTNNHSLRKASSNSSLVPGSRVQEARVPTTPKSTTSKPTNLEPTNLEPTTPEPTTPASKDSSNSPSDT